MNITIKVKFKNVELEMTPDEAKELAEILGGLTHKESKWYPVWVEPYRPWTYPWATWTTTCTGGTGDNITYAVSNKTI